MFKKQLAILIAAAALAASAFAHEEGHGEAAEAGEGHAENYVGVSVSRLTAAPKSNGAAIMLGHHFNEHVAAEVAYEDSGALSSTPEKTSTISISAVGFVPLGTSLEGYGRLGYASARSKDATGVTATHGDITYGVGVEYRLNEAYSVGFGWGQVRIGDNVNIPRGNENSYALTLLHSY
jgi:hypothetical protein